VIWQEYDTCKTTYDAMSCKLIRRSFGSKLGRNPDDALGEEAWEAHERQAHITILSQFNMFTIELSPNYHPAMLWQNATCTLTGKAENASPSPHTVRQHAFKVIPW
jgi:hypothetical protein